jgi:hypothetical protein
VVYTRRGSTPKAEGRVLQRIVLIVIVLVVAWRIAASLGKRHRREGFGADSYSRFSPLLRRRRREWTSQSDAGAPDHLVACQRCGTHVPSRRALTSGSGEVFCGPSCRDRAEAPQAHDA